MPSAVKPDPAPRRWRLQFSLRTLGVIVLIASVFLGVFVGIWRKGEQRRRLIEAGEAADIFVILDDRCVLYRDSWGDRFVRWFGAEHFFEVSDVSTTSSKRTVTPENVERFWTELAKSRHIRALSVASDEATPKRLRDLACKESVTFFQLIGGPVSDEMLAAIAEFPKLTELRFPSAAATSQGFQSLVVLRNLRAMSLLSLEDGAPALNPQSAWALSRLPSLERLTIDGEAVSPETWREIGRHSRLKELSVNGFSPNGDEICASIADSPSLKSITLNGVTATDRGVSELRRCPRLIELCLLNSSVTGSGFSNPTEWNHLEKLSVDGAPISEIGLQNMARLPKLTRLHVVGPILSNRVFVSAEWSESLEEIDMPNQILFEEAVQRLEQLPRLRTLETAIRNNFSRRLGPDPVSPLQ